VKLMLVFSYFVYIFVFSLFSSFSFFLPFPSISFFLVHFLCFLLCHILFCITNSYRYYFVIRYCKHLICIMSSLAFHPHVCLLPLHPHPITLFALCPSCISPLLTPTLLYYPHLHHCPHLHYASLFQLLHVDLVTSYSDN
jgi:hypothetical protein